MVPRGAPLRTPRCARKFALCPATYSVLEAGAPGKCVSDAGPSRPDNGARLERDTLHAVEFAGPPSVMSSDQPLSSANRPRVSGPRGRCRPCRERQRPPSPSERPANPETGSCTGAAPTGLVGADADTGRYGVSSVTIVVIQILPVIDRHRPRNKRQRSVN